MNNLNYNYSFAQDNQNPIATQINYIEGMSCFKDFILHIVYREVSVHWKIWKFNTRPTCKHAFLKT